MRILIASPYLPWPLSHGGSVAQFSTLSCLAQDHDFTLVCPIQTEDQKGHVRELQTRLENVRIRAVYCREPRDPLPVRLLRPAVHFMRALLKPPSETPPQPLPWYPSRPLPPPFIEALRQELERGTDLCQAEFVEMLPLGAWFPSDLPKLFVHHQVHFIYAQRFMQSHGRTDYADYLYAVMRVQELALLRCFDHVITFGEPDRRELECHLGPSKLSVSPFPIPADVGVASAIPRGFDGRFLFVGSERHGPNHDALDWLVTDIWPLILRQLPEARLVVVGQWKKPSKAATATRRISFTGFVNDLSDTLRGGIMLVPLKVGSGIRTKILAALAQGVPVVTTPVGVEGLLISDGVECLVRSEPAEFADAAVQLAQEAVLWRRLAEAGIETVSRHYSPQSVRQRRNEVYSAVVEDHRAGQAKGTW